MTVKDKPPRIDILGEVSWMEKITEYWCGLPMKTRCFIPRSHRLPHRHLSSTDPLIISLILGNFSPAIPLLRRLLADIPIPAPLPHPTPPAHPLRSPMPSPPTTPGTTRTYSQTWLLAYSIVVNIPRKQALI